MLLVGRLDLREPLVMRTEPFLGWRSQLRILRLAIGLLVLAHWGFSQLPELPFAEAQRNAVSQPLPRFPDLANQAQLSGLVEFRFTINSEGHVTNEELISGHPLLIAGTAEAIRTWRYTPFKSLGGGPREITTRIGLKFDASRGSVMVVEPPPLGTGLSAGMEARMSGSAEPYLVSADVLGEHLRRWKLPKYPADAKAQQLAGTVRLKLKIGRDGNVGTVTPVDGDGKLVAVSTDAVRQWVYRPFLRKGSPVEVSGDAYLTFTLNPDAQMPVFPGDDIDALLDAATMTVRDLKVERTEKYCFEAIQRAQSAGTDHAHTVNDALKILDELYSRAGNADANKREDLNRRWVQVATEYEKPNGQWTARALADFGGYLMFSKHYSEAEQYYGRALSTLDHCVDPVGVRICTELEGDVLGYRALTLYAQGKLDESVPFFERAIGRPDGAIHPEIKVVSLVVYSKVLGQLGRSIEASAAAKEALEYQNTHPEAARKAGMTR